MADHTPIPARSPSRIPASASPDSRPARRRFGFLFVHLARNWRRAIDAQLAREGLTDATWTPLVHLDEWGDDIPQTELARRVGLDTSSLVRLLDILEGRGFIARQADPQDRRTRRIVLTEGGRTELARIRAAIAEIEDRLLADLSDARLEQLCTETQQIAARVDAELAAPHSATDTPDPDRT